MRHVISRDTVNRGITIIGIPIYKSGRQFFRLALVVVIIFHGYITISALIYSTAVLC